VWRWVLTRRELGEGAPMVFKRVERIFLGGLRETVPGTRGPFAEVACTAQSSQGGGIIGTEVFDLVLEPGEMTDAGRMR
jgi:hypothetical protein